MALERRGEQIITGLLLVENPVAILRTAAVPPTRRPGLGHIGVGQDTPAGTSHAATVGPSSYGGWAVMRKVPAL